MSIINTASTSTFLVTFSDIFSNADYEGEIAVLPFAEL